MKSTSLLALFCVPVLLYAAEAGDRVTYAGGTVPGLHNKAVARIDLGGADALRVKAREESVEVPYASINTLEYGMKVSRRYVEAVFISPMFLLAKKKAHFLTIGYNDQQGNQQVMVFEVAGSDIRSLLVSLEAKTGRRVEYQDEDARRSGKGS